MIEVIVDIIPNGHEQIRRTIGNIFIVNTSKDNEFGDYKYEIRNHRNIYSFEESKVLAEGKIEGFQRDEGVFALIQKVLEDAPLNRVGDKHE